MAAAAEEAVMVEEAVRRYPVQPCEAVTTNRRRRRICCTHQSAAEEEEEEVTVGVAAASVRELAAAPAAAVAVSVEVEAEMGVDTRASQRWPRWVPSRTGGGASPPLPWVEAFAIWATAASSTPSCRRWRTLRRWDSCAWRSDTHARASWRGRRGAGAGAGVAGPGGRENRARFAS